MFDIITGYILIAVGIGIFITGIVVSIRRKTPEEAGYCALALVPFLFSFFFLTTCTGDRADQTSRWSRVYEEQQQTYKIQQAKMEQDKLNAQIELQRLQIQRIKLQSEMPVESPKSSADSKK
jgi:hypothetical protein